MRADSPTLTVVLPCLNEENTIPDVIGVIRETLQKTDQCSRFDILVVDNGSTDASASLAKNAGAHVLRVEKPGYGNALQAGIRHATGEYVMFLDSDGTYRAEDCGKLFESTLLSKASMGIALRKNKGKGAEPLLHRFLGTPALTALINLLFKSSHSDCNSGFRCLRKADFLKWNPQSTGMEFASELLIKARKHRDKVIEIPSSLMRRVSGTPSLRTWRDGMRHLLLILGEAPHFFERIGLASTVIATVIQVVSLFTGLVRIGHAEIMGTHTQMLALATGIIGVNMYVLSCFLYSTSTDPNPQPLRPTKALLSLSEEALLLLGFLTALGVLGFAGFWGFSGFHGIQVLPQLTPLVHFLMTTVNIAMGIVGVHLVMRRIEPK